jgi:hypothetical protein
MEQVRLGERLDPAERERAMRIADLEADERYRRERYALYRAKSYGPRPTSAARLRELKLASERAEARLRRARQESANSSPAQRSESL